MKMNEDKLTQILNESNLVMTLAVTIGGELVPVIEGAIAEVKKLTTDNSSETIDYQMVLQIGAANLAAAESSFEDVMSKAQAELDRLDNTNTQG